MTTNTAPNVVTHPANFVDVDTPYLFAPKVSVFKGKDRDTLKDWVKGIKVNINPGP